MKDAWQSVMEYCELGTLRRLTGLSKTTERALDTVCTNRIGHTKPSKLRLLTINSFYHRNPHNPYIGGSNTGVVVVREHMIKFCDMCEKEFAHLTYPRKCRKCGKQICKECIAPNCSDTFCNLDRCTSELIPCDCGVRFSASGWEEHDCEICGWRECNSNDRHWMSCDYFECYQIVCKKQTAECTMCNNTYCMAHMIRCVKCKHILCKLCMFTGRGSQRPHHRKCATCNLRNCVQVFCPDELVECDLCSVSVCQKHIELAPEGKPWITHDNNHVSKLCWNCAPRGS